MFNLKDLLEKYKNLKPTEGIIKEELTKILKELLSVELTKEAIRITRNVVYIEASSVFKSALITHKKRILDALFDVTRHRFDDIR